MKQTIKLRPMSERPEVGRRFITATENYFNIGYQILTDTDSLYLNWYNFGNKNNLIGWLYADDLEFTIEVNND